MWHWICLPFPCWRGMREPAWFLSSMELMTFITSLAVSIPGIVQTIYSLSSNFQTYVQLKSFSCLLLHVLCDCCTFYVETIITVLKKISGLESSLFITFVVLVILAAIHLYGKCPKNDVLAWKLKCTHTARCPPWLSPLHCHRTNQVGVIS